MPEMKKESG
jgi:hypothetical protein